MKMKKALNPIMSQEQLRSVPGYRTREGTRQGEGEVLCPGGRRHDFEPSPIKVGEGGVKFGT